VTSSALIERSRARLATVLAGAVLLLVAANPGLAQQAEPQAEPQAARPAEGAAPAAAPAAQPPDRIARLEQQIADLQTMVAALESLVKEKPDVQLPQESVGGESGPAAGMSARIDTLETQVGALSSQLELMTQQLSALEAKLNGGAEPQPLPPPQGEEPLQPLPEERPGRQGLLAPDDPSKAVYADAEGHRDTVCGEAGLRKAPC
jgi:uncharacterized coiled-coil protein SlyX